MIDREAASAEADTWLGSDRDALDGPWRRGVAEGRVGRSATHVHISFVRFPTNTAQTSGAGPLLLPRWPGPAVGFFAVQRRVDTLFGC
jgi:hypothetical protein